MLAASVKPTPIKPVAVMNSMRSCDVDASANAAASVTPHRTIDQREPIHFISNAGRGLERPQVRPSSAKLDPAADLDQCSSDAIVNSTTPSEVKVAAVRKKKNSETTAKIDHARCMPRWSQTGRRRVWSLHARKLARRESSRQRNSPPAALPVTRAHRGLMPRARRA